MLVVIRGRLAADVHELAAAPMYVKMCQRSNEVSSGRAARIFRPPHEHSCPHADDRLCEDFGVEAGGGRTDQSAFFASRGDTGGEPFEDSRRHIAGLSVGVEEDPDQIPLLFGEADQGIRLRVDDVFDFGFVGGGGSDPFFKLARGFFRELSEEGVLILEVEVEGARGVACFRRDVVSRDGAGALVPEEFASGLKQSCSGCSRTGTAALGAARFRLHRGGGAIALVAFRRSTDTHVTNDSNVSLGAG